MPGNGLVTRAKRVRCSDKVDLFEPIVKCIFLSGPDVSKNVGQFSLIKDIKENLEFLSSVLTWAQVEECFGSEIYLDLLSCCRAGEGFIMVI